ncbi:MAG: sigma-70 family RNA polymerase sigma factor [Chloroflexi bacterium]|nr:sigma-70 family RNA polymerase sigma factor [Chloroflexota bacterium]
MDESELIKRCQQGQVICFNALVEKYQGLVYNLALRMLGNSEAAEDATQETFISAWQGINGFRGGNFKAWLLRIAGNACRDQLRLSKRRPSFSLEASLVTLDEPAAPVEYCPEEMAERRMLGEAVQRGLAELDPDQRMAVVLCDMQGLDYEEIATVMGTSLGTVRSRIARGRQHLRDYLVRRGELFGQQIRLNR